MVYGKVFIDNDLGKPPGMRFGEMKKAKVLKTGTLDVATRCKVLSHSSLRQSIHFR
jgi:hypothetical protein